MWEFLQDTGKILRLGIAVVLAVLLCSTGVVMHATERETSTKMLVPVGHTVGIKLFSRGVLVVKQPDQGTPAKECGLRTGDVILQCAGTAVTSTEQFQSLLQESAGNTTNLNIQRGAESVILQVEPEANEEGKYCIGAWIRDSMAGIGTMTYYDPENERFGALGHGITDVDTALLMPFSNGAILPSTVKAVRRGEPGNAGELRGEFDLSRELGDLYANTAAGVFGTVKQEDFPLQEKAIPVGTAVPGKAVIRSNVCGNQVEEFEIEITKLMNRCSDGREMVICVKDPDLIAATGGIVQGMSGSPIIQDGKLVGAVTHVLLNDPCKGYGISVETMLKAAG